ncbi:MAG TPA: FadR/GntR family transcriptional regulator [Smithella sp.]|nr:FadR/GntR family transcriptional regulator [Smithella sp.]HOG89020.1 FadR/GntR family transcriptional regulator [Smithella sp.]HOU49736.1 FadR/GntR family transcriptional regulator [Smithella sp.]HQG64139.1 FadR/GntR family transcriptional regulator [Smithella sp.]HQH17126.1 FadR/GntR family transcriptional regulator [Smithella sp.]
MAARKILTRPITRSRLHEEIVKIIQKQIMEGEMSPGDKLPTERELAETFDVNRATVREALRKLENLDLVEIRHGDGLYVKNYLESGNFDLIKAAINMNGRHEVFDNILEARRYVVPQMAYLAAQNRTKTDLEEFGQIVVRDDLSMLEKDIRMHQMIARATHNIVCTISLNFFNQIFREYGHLYFDDEHNVERSRIFHREIYEAIKNKKPEHARRIMKDVLLYAEDAVKTSMKEKRSKR